MLKTFTFALYVLSLALSITSVLFGIISWILLKKWRQFRHFAFLSFIIAGTSFLTWMHIAIVILITHIQMSHWQLITTILIYMALVEVFNSVKVRCKYLLVCLFAWVLPIIKGVVMIFALDEWVISWIIVSLVELSILLTNLVFYVKVVYNLLRLLKRQKISLRDVCGKVLVSTLACVTAGLPPVLGTIIMQIFVADYGIVSLLDPQVAILPNLINVLLAIMFFLFTSTALGRVHSESKRGASNAAGLHDAIATK